MDTLNINRQLQEAITNGDKVELIVTADNKQQFLNVVQKEKEKQNDTTE